MEKESDFQEDAIEFQLTIIYQDISNGHEEHTYNLTALKGNTLYESFARHHNLQVDEGVYFSIVDLDFYRNSPESTVL